MLYAACNANTFRISILIERGNNLWLEKRAREDRGRGGKLIYLQSLIFKRIFAKKIHATMDLGHKM